MTRAHRVQLVGVTLLPWLVGTLVSLSASSNAVSSAVNGLASSGAVITLVALTAGWYLSIAWCGIAVAALALSLGALSSQEYAIWPAGACWLLLVVAGFAATRAHTVSGGVLVAVAAAGAVLPAVPLAREDPGLWVVVILAAAASATAIWIGLRHRAAQHRLASMNSKVRAVERKSMARELHDVIAHEVTGIVVLAQAATAAGADTDGVLGRIEQSGVRALSYIRAMVDMLSDPEMIDSRLAPFPSGTKRLSSSLNHLGEEVAVTVEPEADSDDVPDLHRLIAHRVVCEGVTNARRYAPGSRIDVHIHREKRLLVVAVTDTGPADGVANGPGRGSGTGVPGLVERAATVGGTVTSAREGAGWRLSAQLPIHEELSSR